MWKEIQPQGADAGASGGPLGEISPFLSGPEVGAAPDTDQGKDTDRFVVLGILGQGRIGTVLHVLDRTRQRPVALKTWTDGDLGPAIGMALFRREQHLLERVEDPRHLVRLFEVTEYEDGTRVLPAQVMELAEGGDLRGYLDHRTTPTRMEAGTLEIVSSVCGGLAALHRAGLVHGDVKPANILRVDGVWKLGDTTCMHGCAPEDNEALDILGKPGALSTPAYRAPELCGGKPPTPETDVYALGLVFLQLLRPSALQIIEKTRAPERADRLHACAQGLRHVPHFVKMTLSVCLEPKKGQRLKNAMEVEEALGTVPFVNGELPKEAARPPSPFSAELIFEEAQRAYGENALTEAAGLCHEAIRITPGHEAASALLLEIARRHEEASQCYAVLRARDGSLDLRDGVALTERAEGLYPGHPAADAARTALMDRAAAYNRLVNETWEAVRGGQWTAARQHIEAALERVPSAPGLRQALAQVAAMERVTLFFQQKIHEAAARNGGGEATRHRQAFDLFLQQRVPLAASAIGNSLCTFAM